MAAAARPCLSWSRLGCAIAASIAKDSATDVDAVAKNDNVVARINQESSIGCLRDVTPEN